MIIVEILAQIFLTRQLYALIKIIIYYCKIGYLLFAAGSVDGVAAADEHLPAPLRRRLLTAAFVPA
jgi:hypothetical protein